MKITMTTFIERQRARLDTQEAKTFRNIFIFKKPNTFQKARHFAKIKTICDTFLYTKIRQFALPDFSLKF